jgi:hypothetical protein
MFTKAHHWTLSWASWIQFASSIPISLRSIFKSHVLFPLLRSCQRISPGPRRFETFRNKNFYCEEFLAPRPTPKWRTTPCRLFATGYSIYSQLPSVTGGLPSIRNLRTRHAVVTRDPPNMEITLPVCPKCVRQIFERVMNFRTFLV